MLAKKLISRTFSVLLTIALMLAVAPHQTVQAAGVRYVKQAASGTGDCTSWGNACTLLTALTAAISGDEVWAAAGTYKPTMGTDRNATFQLKNGVALYGGFVGTETARNERNPAINITTLSGDLNGDDVGFSNNEENVLHVVTGATGGTLDGFTVTAGNANGSDCNPGCGGGMININSSPTVTNVIFSGNYAFNAGGGMVNGSSSPTLTNVTFNGNSVGWYGGGLFGDNSSPTLMNVIFKGNSSQSGPGGGFYNNPGGNPTLTNVTFSGNSAPSNGGGGMFNFGSSPTLTNVTFNGNSAGGGAGFYNYQGGTAQIRNTIFWGNTSSGGGAQIIYDHFGTPNISDSVVQDGYAEGTNIIDDDPMLGTLGNYGGSTETIPLLAGSSAIDAGNDSVCPPTDQRGMTRPQGAQCDIGAFEYKSIYYTKPIASGTEDGRSWANASTLQTALTGAVSGDEIWVAAGMYKPTTGTERTATFQLIDGVALYGGFAGTETTRDQRDLTANITILSGDIDNNDIQSPIITDLITETGNTTNSYHVVTGATGATMDGFTITAGYASGGSCPGTNCGAGMFNLSSSPTLINLTFSGNSAEYGGGGMFNYSSNPSVTNATFSGNFGGLNGGGMENNYSNPTVTNVTFSGNTATTYAGGMANTFSSPTLTNVTFSNNSATTYGGGMENWGSLPIIRNTIFWGNTAPNGAQIHDDSGGAASMSDSVVQGGYAGTNILTTDPLLGSLGNFGGFTQTIPLLAGSSAIDTGNDATCSITDQRGIIRPQGPHCDIGAFELQTLLMAVPGGQTSGLCGSWANACELRYALTSAMSGQEIWAAAGTYKPTTGANRSATFQLKNGVALYGGFAGTETVRDERDPMTNVTILSGDIDNNDSQKPIITDLTTVTGNSTNSYNVVTGANNAILDGFTITAGYANGDTCPNKDCYGGGIYNYSSSPELINIIFSGNWATYGGGMFNENSHPTLTNVIFNNNSVQYGGGGMFGQGSSSPTLTNVTFSGNAANRGGGMFNHNSSNPTLTNVTFSENSADEGGGLYNQVSSNPTLTNVTFSSNSANKGGALYNSGSSPTMTNVTFSGNSAVDHGGGMYIADLSYPQFRNTIFWGNTAAGGIGAQIYNFSGNTTSSDSVVQGGCADTSWSCDTNIITADPMLGTLGDYGGFTQTIPLLPGSSAINTGNDGVCPATDQRGVTRPQGAHCDIGAFELRLFNIFLPLILR